MKRIWKKAGAVCLCAMAILTTLISVCAVLYQLPEEIKGEYLLYSVGDSAAQPILTELSVTRKSRLWGGGYHTGVLYKNGKPIVLRTLSGGLSLDQPLESLWRALGLKARRIWFANMVYSSSPIPSPQLVDDNKVWIDGDGNVLLTAFPDGGGFGADYCGPADSSEKALEIYKSSFQGSR